MNKKLKIPTETKTRYNSYNPYKSVVQLVDTCDHNKELIAETRSNFPKEYVSVIGRKGETNE
ncbi:MAG: hypothetical protein VZR64_00310 [Eubacterium sp.]|nr:hypothetical protein [Eubacterium sp.]